MVLARQLLAALVAVIGVTACTTTEDDPGAGTLGPDDTTVDTLVAPGDTVPNADELPEAVVDRLVRKVPEMIGIELEIAQRRCISESLSAAVDAEALVALGLGGAVTDQPLDVQAAIFKSFDDCVSPEELGRVASPILELAGVTPARAACVFSTLREQVGFAGMYVFGLTRIGEVEHNPELDRQVSDAYQACDVDPAELTDPTPATVAPATPSTTVVPPVDPPTEVVGTSTTRVARPTRSTDVDVPPTTS